MEVESKGRGVSPAVAMAPSAVAAAATGPFIQGPVVGNLSVSDQSTVHVGPKVYKVTQHVTHNEVVKGERHL